MSLFKRATFHTTVAKLSDLPADSVGEVAFAGRSNVGKSSAINTLADHTRLAFVSKTPGRTQYLNYFQLGEGRYWVDLPGYGYAKAPTEIRDQWEGLLAPYLLRRAPLAGLILIMDSRHPLTELDTRMIDWFAQTDKPIHILLSKADKLTRSDQTQVVREVKEALAGLGERCSVQLFSSLKHTGVEEAETVLCRWLDIAPGENTDQAAKRETPGKTAKPRNRKAIGWSARTSGKTKSAQRQKAPNQSTNRNQDTLEESNKASAQEDDTGDGARHPPVSTEDVRE
ncbi:MAG: ribosome biogenesis GTP-binding protein YihA/YsxC [Candidatus Accumulibacter sp.]|jgi:GTP-binding protein|nr:ribosome biogenesis GTP-binding protein YihA/YsxC [Accumulibacter sp.]